MPPYLATRFSCKNIIITSSIRFPIKNMKTHTTSASAAVLLLFGCILLGACSSSNSPSPSTTATVTMTAETDGAKASSAFQKYALPLGPGIAADSIELTRVRFLLSAVKLHVEGNDTTNDREIKAGPFILEFTPGYSRVFSTVTIPAGTYEKIKFEIHKFPSSIDQTYLYDPTFNDFVTGERSTIIIEGKVWSAKSTTPVNFLYKSHITLNVEAKFPGSITLAAGSTATLAMVFSPLLAFKASTVLDPRDPNNANDIDNFLKTAMKALKR